MKDYKITIGNAYEHIIVVISDENAEKAVKRALEENKPKQGVYELKEIQVL